MKSTRNLVSGGLVLLSLAGSGCEPYYITETDIKKVATPISMPTVGESSVTDKIGFARDFDYDRKVDAIFDDNGRLIYVVKNAGYADDIKRMGLDESYGMDLNPEMREASSKSMLAQQDFIKTSLNKQGRYIESSK